jgi:hypothetical protein
MLWTINVVVFGCSIPNVNEVFVATTSCLLEYNLASPAIQSGSAGSVISCSLGRIAFEIVVQRSSFLMAARPKRRQSPVAAAAAPRTTATESKHAATTNVQAAAVATADDQLPPLFLQAVVICCSGFWLVIALRDFATTGKSIFGTYDDTYLVRAPIRRYFCSIDDPSIMFAMSCLWFMHALNLVPTTNYLLKMNPNPRVFPFTFFLLPVLEIYRCDKMVRR